MADTRDAIARYDEWTARVVKTPGVTAARAQRMKRRGEAFARRLGRMVGGATAVVLLAFLWGLFVNPIGFSGIVMTLFAAFSVFLFLAFVPGRRAVPEVLPEMPLKALPAQLEDWLDVQRRALPPPAAREIDRIMVQLDALAPDLKAMAPADPRSDEARRLLADHLPRLVRSYTEVPAHARHGAEAQTHLKDGLKTVSAELDRLGRALAEERLTALEVEGRFLENRYRDKVGEA